VNVVPDSNPAVTTIRPSTSQSTVALAVTLSLAAGCWVLAIWQMTGMNMGVATSLGSFAFFAAVWVPMMAAMMLPGAVPAVLRRARVSGQAVAVPLFVVSYLAVWALAGVAVYALYRPHGTAAAGALVIAAGVYELTPVKQHFRRLCRERAGPGWEFGLCCVGSSIGLMLVLIVVGVMSITWMAVIAVLVLAQKLLPAKTIVDLPLALAIIGFGIWILAAPASVPGLMPSM
jgi:predicted metal-binding membrane protein